MPEINIANELFLNKKFEDAVLQYEKILQNDPQDLSALNNKGYTLSKLKRYEAAIECFNHSLQIKPDDKLVQVNIISVYRKTGRIDDAFLLNLYAGYDFMDHYKIQAGVNNATDLEYISSRHPSGARAGAPLTAYIKAVANF